MANRVEGWKALSLECFKSAQILRTRGMHRSSVNRSYYAAYCAITANLPQETQFAHGMQNPSHQQIRKLLDSTLGISPARRKRHAKALNFLWHSRVDADYRPTRSIAEQASIDCIHHASLICSTLEVI